MDAVFLVFYKSTQVQRQLKLNQIKSEKICNLLLLLVYGDATLVICSQKQFARAHSWVIAHPNAYSASKLRALL